MPIGHRQHFWMEHFGLGRECVCIACLLGRFKLYGNPSSRRIILVQPEHFHPSFFLLPSSVLSLRLFHTSSQLRFHYQRILDTEVTISLVLLYSLPSRPPFHNPFFQCLRSPNPVEVLMNRLEPVLDGPEPSKDVLWKQNPSEGAQDAIRPLLKLAKTPNTIDSDRPLPRMPLISFEETMREEQMVPQHFIQDWRRNSDSPEVAQKPSDSSKGDEDSQVPLPSADRAVHTASLRPQERVASGSLTYTLNNDHPYSELAAQNRASELDQGRIVLCTSSVGSQKTHLKQMSPVESDNYHRASSQASRDLTWIEEQIRVPTKPIAEAVNPEDGLIVQTAGSGAFIDAGCLCGCGGDAMRCLRPNRPSSPVPDTPFEKSLASDTGYIIKLRLEAVVRNLEPSRRIWWREEFGGCAPDRKPLASEISTRRDNDLVNVLRTSLPLFNDVTTIRNKAQDQPSRKRQRSMSLPTTPTHSQDENSNLPQNYTCPLNKAPKSAPLYESSKNCKASATEFGNSRPHNVRGRPLFREPIVAPKAKPLKSPTSYVPDKLPPRKYYAAGKLPPIKFTGLLKESPPHPEIQESTAEEREKRLQSTLQNIQAAGRKVRQLLATNVKRISLPLENRSTVSKCDSVHQAQLDAEVKKKARNTERFQQMNQRLNHNIEAMKVRKDSRQGTALYRHDRWVPDDLPTPHIHHIGETQWKSMDPRMRLEAYQDQRSMYQPLDMTKLRRTAVTL